MAVNVPKVVIQGFAIWIYTRDERGHRPHVHVLGSDGEVVIVLSDPVCVREARGMKLNEVRRALAVVAENRDQLLFIWSQFNG